MRSFMQTYAPDLLWDYWCWREKDAERRGCWGSFRSYRNSRKALRSALWGGE